MEQQSREELAGRLRGILGKILVGVPGSSVASADEIGAEADFAELGINSVDFLEFVISVETELGVDIPDEALGDPHLRSLEAWAGYLVRQAGQAA
jgi:acyl carrier protein